MKRALSPHWSSTLAIGGVLLVALFQFWNIWTAPTNIAEYGEKYSKSQYVLGTQSTQNVSDSELYVYAGFAYITGQDPTTINFEHPPLGKYVYGLSQLLTGNTYLVNLLLLPLYLLLTYHLASILVKNVWVKAGILLLVGLQPVVFAQMQYALLDYLFSIGILGLFCVLNQKRTKPLAKYFLVGILLGIIAAIKYPIPFIFIPFAIVGAVAWKERQLRLLPVVGIASIAVYLLSYTVYFAHGHSLLDLLAFEKYRFNWWTGDRSMPKFLIFQNLLTGRYTAWWDSNVLQVTREWNPLLPLTFGVFLVSLLAVRKYFWWVLIASFGLGMIIVYGFAAAASLRYLTLLLPFWATVIGSAVERKIPKLCFQTSE